MKICCKCKLLKLLDDFGSNIKNKDGKQKYCKECGRKSQRIHYEKSDNRRIKVNNSRRKNKDRNFLYLLGYLQSHPCVDCGEKDPITLDFDHVQGVKRCSISELSGCSIETLQTEMNKCEVRCANCHRRKTAKQFSWRKFRAES